MLEAVTGSSIEAVIDGVAAEVDITQTALPEPEDNEMPDPATHGYVFDAGAASLAESGATVESGTDVTDWSVAWGGAGGSMYATIEDLGAWAASGFGNTILAEETATERLETALLPTSGSATGGGSSPSATPTGSATPARSSDGRPSPPTTPEPATCSSAWSTRPAPSPT